MSNKALIYCRVSSQKQVIQGTGNKSQEQRCREYCHSKQYEVVKVFVDDGVSGGLFERPAMEKLISYLDEHPSEEFVIVFDDLSRFARKLDVHLKLKTELKSRGCILECLNFNFDDSPEGELIENVTASMNQYDREKNKRQVIQKQKARLEQGYWPFGYPKGFKNIRTTEHGKLLVWNEPHATIYKKAIEGYANNTFVAKVEVENFINSEYARLNLPDIIHKRKVESLLTKILYAGYIEYPKWGVDRIKGKHKGLVSLETYLKVQKKLKKKARKPKRKDYNKDFPLRGYVLCSHCKKPMTASWNVGNGGRYPNYACKQEGCEMRWKPIRKYVIEPKFEDLLEKQGSIKKPYLDLAKVIFTDAWNEQRINTEQNQKALKKQISELEEQIKTSVDKYTKVKDETIASALEDRIKDLKQDKDSLFIKASSVNDKIYSTANFGTLFETISTVLQNPLAIWKQGDLETKGVVIDMYFDELPQYDREEGFGTTTFSYPVRVLQSFEKEKSQLVEMGGVEPPC